MFFSIIRLIKELILDRDREALRKKLLEQQLNQMQNENRSLEDRNDLLFAEVNKVKSEKAEYDRRLLLLEYYQLKISIKIYYKILIILY